MKKLIFILIMMFSTVAVFAQNKDGIVVSSPIKEKVVTISPNPAISDINISIVGKSADVKSISIYSIIGTEVISQNFNSTSKSIPMNVRNLKKGKYLVRVIFADNSTEVATLIKQ